MKAVFLDRDGTINVGVPTYERVSSLDKIVILPKTIEALTELAALDYGVFFVTNQAGLAEGIITSEQFDEINEKIIDLIAPSNISILKTYVCPHGSGSVCDCQKPSPKLLQNAATEYNIDLSKSWMIGDRPSDVECGINAGTKTILVKTGVASVVSEGATFTAPTLLEAVDFIASHPS